MVSHVDLVDVHVEHRFPPTVSRVGGRGAPGGTPLLPGRVAPFTFPRTLRTFRAHEAAYAVRGPP